MKGWKGHGECADFEERVSRGDAHDS
jgi:hypothetical protein